MKRWHQGLTLPFHPVAGQSFSESTSLLVKVVALEYCCKRCCATCRQHYDAVNSPQIWSILWLVLLLLVSFLSVSSFPAIPWKLWLYSASGSCRVSEEGLCGCWVGNRPRPCLHLPRALGLGRLRIDPLDDCLENWREYWRPRWRVGWFWTLSVVQRNAFGPSWVGEQQNDKPVLEIQRTG